MILRALYEFGQARHLLEALAFKGQAVRWVIDLDLGGGLIGPGPAETTGERPGKGKEYPVPKTSRPAGSGIVADFLVDDIGAIFGLPPDAKAEQKPAVVRKRAAKHADFWRQVAAAHEATGRVELAAMLAFRRSLQCPPPFLRPDPEARLGWSITRASGEAAPLGNDLLTFAVDGTILFLDPGLRDYWRGVAGSELAAAEKAAARGVCLITGACDVPLARTHTPMVTGLPKPAKATGAGLVVFQSPAFCSYGQERSLNAPTSIAASKVYLLALQHLFRSTDHRIALGPAWLCVWAAESEEASSLFARLLRRADPEAVRAFVRSPRGGLPRPLPAAERFYAATLTAAGPRLILKGWLQATVGETAARITRWFADMDLDGPPPREGAPPALAIGRLAGTVAPLKSVNGKVAAGKDKLPPDLVSQLYGAALTGSAPPISLVKRLLDRLSSRLLRDESYRVIFDRSRFALLRLTLNRNRGPNMEIPPALAAETADPAYNCGRLLAVLHATQLKAHEFKLEGRSIAERYFGAASVSPASVLPLLLRVNRHHLRKIATGKYRGDERFLEEAIRSIAARFEPVATGSAPDFPQFLDLHAQGRFALGFYQQAAADESARRAARASSASDSDGGPEMPTEE